MKETIINITNYDCPFCEEEHDVQIKKRMAKANFKGVIIEYEQIVYYCSIEEDEFVPAKIMDENLLRARDSYRKSNELLTSVEIKKIRELYKLTQKEFSLLLGWGNVTIGRYEKKLIQDETYDNIMRMSLANPTFTLEMLEKHKNKFEAHRYAEVKKDIKKVIKFRGNYLLKIQEIKNTYIDYDTESDYNGYKLLNIKKVNAVMGYFAQYINPLYKVKLMKLLWYADVISFKRSGKAMTGLVYQHLPLGAVPLAYNELLFLPSIKVVEEYFDNFTAYKITLKQEMSLSDFTLEEMAILEEVASFFKDVNTKKIVNYMHKEIAYIETNAEEIIPYSLAIQIREFESN